MANHRALRAAAHIHAVRSLATTVPFLLVSLCLAGTGPPCAAAEVPVRLAQGADDLLQLGKEALGLTETTPESSEQTDITSGVPFLIRFRETVGSLEAGAPVLVRGMRMGTVRDVTISFDVATASFNIPVVIELDPAPFAAGEPTGEAAKRVYGVIDAMVRNGLRAEIVGANLLMGSLAVALEVQPEAPPAELRQGHGGPPEIPTVSLPFQPLSAQVERVAARISALPLERIVKELEGTIAAARRIVDDPAVPLLLANLASASDVLVPAARQLDPTLRAATAVTDQARESLAQVQELLNQSRALPEQIVHLLEEIEDTARSLRLLAEMLERQPEAILRGKDG
jgi:paraquat-inducible protein B